MKAALPALLAAALLTLAPAAASADEPPRIAVRLSYELGPGVKHCPPEQTLHDEVARRIGYDPFTPDAPDRIVATLKRSPAGLTAMVERFDSKGVRQWEPQRYDYGDCVGLVQTMGIYISEMFRPPLVLPQATTPSPSPPAALPPAVPKVEPPPAPASVPPKLERTPPRSEPLRPLVPTPRRRWGGQLGVSGGPGFGVAPAKVAPLLSLEVGFQRWLTPDWVLSGSLGVLYSPRTSATMPVDMSRAEVEISTTLVTSVLAPCVHRSILFGWGFGCLGLQLGYLRWEHAEIPSPVSAATWWAAVAPRLGVEVGVPFVPMPRITRLALRVFGDLPVPLLRPPALVEVGPLMSHGRMAQVWVTPPVMGAVSVGLVLWVDPT